MHILRQLPFLASESTIVVASETIAIRAYQIVVWVSVSAGDSLPQRETVFPAVLDTGHNHNFSIRHDRLVRWAGNVPEQLPKSGAILVNQQEIPLRQASLWIHRNRPGQADLLPRPFRLDLPEGISVYGPGVLGAPRLPLLGLRGLMRNRLRLVLRAMDVSLSQGR